VLEDYSIDKEESPRALMCAVTFVIGSVFSFIEGCEIAFLSRAEEEWGIEGLLLV
jgi:hypothetical protein